MAEKSAAVQVGYGVVVVTVEVVVQEEAVGLTAARSVAVERVADVEGVVLDGVTSPAAMEWAEEVGLALVMVVAMTVTPVGTAEETVEETVEETAVGTRRYDTR